MARLSFLLLLLLCSFRGLSQETATVITAGRKDMIARMETGSERKPCEGLFTEGGS